MAVDKLSRVFVHHQVLALEFDAAFAQIVLELLTGWQSGVEYTITVIFTFPLSGASGTTPCA
jgi:hypothetical protein